ncbi:beta-ketoacyl-ACP synthase II [uncultured Flavonifractor sp.]|uniref:beta-ketoacyl-ACP synthase II n=1 Tax=uncultured Flavonifractor sp. TaxID=1193534 RepID=UPI002635454F|nr:beta-ketoacyl-ACP synthase II [uncultured Flavonifractor sp.]
MEKRRVVITGMGSVNPLGHNITETWQAVKNGVCGIAPITQYDSAMQKVHLAAEVKDWDPTSVLDKKEVRHMSRYAQLAMASAKEAVADSGLDLERLDRTRCGVIVSSGVGGISGTEQEQTRCMEKGFDRASPFYIPSTIANMGAGLIAIAFGFQGMCTCPVTACAGGSNAVGDAFRHIRDGYAEVMLCGGAEAAITPLSIGGFTSMRALHVGDDPDRASIPFDAERSGFVMGEGAGILLLEEYEHAKARGAKVYAEVLGYGATCDAYHMTAPAPNGEGGARAMALALADGGVAPEQVGYINAHGTSTPLNDSGETAAIKTVFGDHAYKLAVSSTKSMTGHMLGAAGAVEAIFSALTLHDGYLPATIHYQVADPACDLDYVPNQGRAAQVEYVLSNSLGFGGHNACVLFKKWEG